ncbi:FGF signaling regulator protein canopy b isoform X3 [Rhodnius prolixus]|uniref:FGF signaling regulator protein canopy b isoform X3 n=1 Tax=Rhodnius prolixus TaxID=13249 RepID=UPI003D18CC0D
MRYIYVYKMKYLLISIIFISMCHSSPDDDEGVKYADKCEVCKILAIELENRLHETGKTKEMIETGYSVDDIKPKKKKEYTKSEKGVKVDLGIPHELWDKPSVEITNMKSQCETVLENYESDIEDWYFNHQHVSLKTYLCKDRALKNDNASCLKEDHPNEAKKGDSNDRKKEEL